MEMPFVSFIISYYDVPTDMLVKCIRSITALSLLPAEREIIVVDDGSPQSPLPALDSLTNDITYIRQQNQGLSQARNTGLQMAKAQYIQFVDADDYLIPAAYEHCLRLARNEHTDVVMFDFTTIDDETGENRQFSASRPTSGTHYLSHHNLHATAWGYLFRRSLLGELRFTPGIYHEDEEFTPQLLLRADTVCTTDAQAYFYRQRPHSITSETNLRKVVKRLNDKQFVIEHLHRISDTMPVAERNAMQRRVAQLTMDYIYNIITQTRSRHFLERKLGVLRRKGLYPLPDRDYTSKYTWFRWLANNGAGLTLLMRALPLMHKER